MRTKLIARILKTKVLTALTVLFVGLVAVAGCDDGSTNDAVIDAVDMAELPGDTAGDVTGDGVSDTQAALDAPEDSGTGDQTPDEGAQDADAQDARDGLEVADVGGDGDDTRVIDAPVIDAADSVDSTDVSDTADTADASDTADTSETSDADMLPSEPLGTISGLCGELDMTELTDGNAYYFANAIDFGMDPFDDPADVPRLTPGGQEVYADGNAGGSSLYSEIFAYEVLARCEMASLLKTETEIVYDTTHSGAITDLLVEIDGTKIGVSVTRAVAFPFSDPYSVAQAQTLLEDKLADVLESSGGVDPQDAWQKQILHVIAYGPMHADSLQTAFGQIEPSLTADTIVWVTVSNGDDAFLY